MSGVKTYLTSEYFINYLKRNNINVPNGCDIKNIFEKYDTTDIELKKAVNPDGSTGDGHLNWMERTKVTSELRKNNNAQIAHALKACEKEVEELQKQELLQSPPNLNDEYFFEWGYRYIEEKLKEKGIEEIDFDKIDDLFYNFDYDFDENRDSYIDEDKTNYIYKNNNTGETYQIADFINKGKNNLEIKTHILDWMVNKYISDMNK